MREHEIQNLETEKVEQSRTFDEMMCLFEKYKAETEQEIYCLNQQIRDFKSDLELKLKNEDDLKDMLEKKTTDYNRLSDSYFRNKRDSEDQESQSKEYINSLEAKVKELSTDIDKKSTDLLAVTQKNSDLAKQVGKLTVEKQKVQEKL